MSDEPPKPKLIQHEWRAQEADQAFLAKALPRECFYTAIDGGRAQSRAIGGARRRRGIKSGLPDWLIVWQGITLWIERKVSKAESDLGHNQRLTAERLQANGHLWARANSTEELEAALVVAGIPLRATLGGIRSRIEAQDERLPPKRKKGARRGLRADNGMTLAAYRRAHQRGFL